MKRRTRGAETGDSVPTPAEPVRPDTPESPPEVFEIEGLAERDGSPMFWTPAPTPEPVEPVVRAWDRAADAPVQGVAVPGTVVLAADAFEGPLQVAPTVVVAVDELIEADYNPHVMTEAEAEHLGVSIDDFGLVEDLVVNRHPDRYNVVVGGHKRLRHARARGQRTLPAKIVYLDIEREVELNARLNANHGRFDHRLLVEGGYERAKLEAWGFPDEDLRAFDRAAKELEAFQGGFPEEFPEVDPEVLLPADVKMTLGEYNFTVPRAQYDAWLAEIRESAGWSEEAIVGEIRGRMGLPVGEP